MKNDTIVYTKSDLAHQLSERKGISIDSATAMIDDVFDGIVLAVNEAVEEDRHCEIHLRGYLRIRTKSRQPRERRNPRTGEKLIIDESVAISIAPGKCFKDAILGRKIS